MADYTLYWYSGIKRVDSRANLARAAAFHLGQTPDYAENIRIETADKGKPFFPDFPELFGSVSHSGEYWLVALGSGAVGIDLQKHEPCNRSALATRFFHPDEQAFLALNGYEDFYRVWAAKESYVKKTGAGIDHTFSEFAVANVLGGMKTVLAGTQLRYLPFRPDYTLYICAEEVGQTRFLPGK